MKYEFLILFHQKLFHGISDVLADRTIKIRTKKINNGIKLEEFSPDKKMEKEFRDIVNDVYIFGLTYANKIYDIYNHGKLPKVEKISVREKDIWKPLLTISSIIDEESNTHVTENLIKYSLVLNEEKRRINLENNISYKLINILDEFLESRAKPSELKDRTKVGYGIQRVFEFIKGTEEFEDIKIPQHLSKLLNNNLDIRSERVYDILGNRLRIYLFDKNVIEDLKNRYNLKTTE